MNESKPNSGWNESKPTSGWNESKPSFPITMNVGEAMAYSSKDKCFWTGEMHTALETLTKEVERLRDELAQCQSVLDGTRTELSICQSFHSIAKKEWQLEVEKVNRLEAQLAAAKAASERSYTPGPWEVREVDGLFAIAHPAGWVLESNDVEQDRIDARLIAAAPEMFELLTTLENDDGAIPAWLWEQIQEVVRKVKGDQ